jgi:hypothetical protein
VRTTEAASEDLLRAVEGKGRTITYALPGSEELRYLDYMGANANVGGPTMTDILLRQNPTKVEVVEEFLHGTQNRLGIIDRVGVRGAEIHVFHFADGRTVLIGPIDGDVNFIRACKCELLVDGVPTSVIQIEGEMMPARGLAKGYRSVSTRDAISVDRRALASSACVLRPLSDLRGAGG